MLFFVDAPTSIRVYRETDSGEWSKKDKLGLIPKKSLELRPEPGVSLSEEDHREIQEAIESYRNAAAVQLHLDALRFPEIARNAAEYYMNHATETEKRLIAVALQEAMRAIRKSGLAKIAA